MGLKLLVSQMPYFLIAEVSSLKPYVPEKYFTNYFEEEGKVP